VKPRDLKGEVPHASQVMSNDNKIPKSREKFHQREQRLKKLFDAQLAQWQRENPSLATQESSIAAVPNEPALEKFQVDVRLYKERGDDYCIIGNKIQYRACEQNVEGQNYINKQALDTKGNFDPIRIRLRIKPISSAPLAQGKTPEFYFLEAAKKSLSGNLLSAIELLKRGLMINPNHGLCRFNHGVLMFKFGLIRNAKEDFEALTVHPHGCKDPWVFYNLAICLIQLGYPEKDQDILEQRKKGIVATAKLSRKSTVRSFEMSLSKKPRCDKGKEYYTRAAELCDKAYALGRDDKEIIVDAMNLKGICLFRLGNLIEAVKML